MAVRHTALKTRTPINRGASQLKRTRLNPRRKKPPKRAINYSDFALPKLPKPIPVLWEIEGRIKYNRRHPQGAHLYDCAVTKMWLRQDERCSIGGEKITRDLGTFEHGGLRGMGGAIRNDDPDALAPDGTYINSCACAKHNRLKGSRRDYPMAIRLKQEDAAVKGR